MCPDRIGRKQVSKILLAVGHPREFDLGIANKRAEMWGFMKEWLKAGILPDDNVLTADLKAVEVQGV